jgi:prepilin signal peptidase PulO-like enzyme (type II secretory pathway)
MNWQPATTWFTSPFMLLAILPVAAIAGRLLTRGVARLVEPGHGDGRIHRVVEIVIPLTAASLWWWEVILQGQLPTGMIPQASDLAARYAAHMILLLFLAAAAWVDLRHRVIPDAITVPGVLAGLGWNALFPFTLLPIATYVERSFATPAMTPDVLALRGGLGEAELPAWLVGTTGLSVALSIFAAWWWVGTAAEDTPPSAASHRRPPWLPSSRVLVALAGSGMLVAAWSVGGDHWAGIMTALVGLAMSGGLVWATRTGASWAIGREAMGFGDVTLMAMAGAWLGWQACLLACVIAVFIGLVHGLTQLIVRSESELPFGPSLCLALAIVVVGWRSLWEMASPQFERPMDMAIVTGLVIVMTAITLWAWARFRGLPSQRSN